jgi:NAD(P)-dependent dehydrogenase (short-subunit alcohol dehydrogenase family)
MSSKDSKVAVVTGASRGLGRSTALALARSGVDVIITYHTKRERALEVVREIEQMDLRAAALQLDAANHAALPAFKKALSECLTGHFKRNTFEILINNAGFGLNAPFADTTVEMFDQLLNVHLKGVFFLTQTVLPLIENDGRIINLSSGLTRFSFPGYTAYAVMKGGIEVLTRFLAKELGPRGIAVNTVAPGAIETDFGGGEIRDNASLNKMIAGMTALGRAGLPDDIGPFIATLVSENGRWVNGQRLEASGGMLL